MQLKVEYIDQTQRQEILNVNSDKYLIEEQNISDGNFLIFSDTKPLELQLKDLYNTTNMILLKQEGII